ncbi:MAG: toll/interleukin-1 receptor domain-containing protein [Crocinitomix sp.]|nr:toll/interleukin-1 receptor domain-containing protein [Crocinitomix sp.]
MKKMKYDVAISFANEDMDIALCIYLALKFKRKDGKVFYYKETYDNAGKSLKDQLPIIYGEESQFVVAIISKNYLNSQKVYATIESNAIIERWKKSKEKTFLIPLLIDGTNVNEINPVFPNDVVYVLWDSNPESIAEKIWNMIAEIKYKESTQNKSSKMSTDHFSLKIKETNNLQVGILNFGKLIFSILKGILSVIWRSTR